jgi:hypothetical protein
MAVWMGRQEFGVGEWLGEQGDGTEELGVIQELEVAGLTAARHGDHRQGGCCRA